MTNTGKQIAELMMDTGKSAPDMTHAVKILGDGSMQNGFSRIGEYFMEENAIASGKGLFKGRIQGCIAGAVAVSLLGGITLLVASKKEKKTNHEAEGQEILKAVKLSDSVSATSSTRDETYTKENDNQEISGSCTE